MLAMVEYTGTEWGWGVTGTRVPWLRDGRADYVVVADEGIRGGDAVCQRRESSLRIVHRGSTMS